MDYRALGRGECWDGPFSHVIGSSELVDLWEIRIKKPMILCARSTSRSREQRVKRRSRSENMRKVCLFYNQNNKILWLSNMADTHEVRKGIWDCFFIVLFGCWLAGKANTCLSESNINFKLISTKFLLNAWLCRKGLIIRWTDQAFMKLLINILFLPLEMSYE